MNVDASDYHDIVYIYRHNILLFVAMLGLLNEIRPVFKFLFSVILLMMFSNLKSGSHVNSVGVNIFLQSFFWHTVHI